MKNPEPNDSVFVDVANVSVEVAKPPTPSVICTAPTVPVAEPPDEPPTIPRELVARRSYPPLLFPTNNFPYVGAVDVPVPPFAIPKTPNTSDTSDIEDVAKTFPETDFKNPVKLPIDKLVTVAFESVAFVATKLVVLVVEAFIVSAFVVELLVVDAFSVVKFPVVPHRVVTYAVSADNKLEYILVAVAFVSEALLEKKFVVVELVDVEF